MPPRSTLISICGSTYAEMRLLPGPRKDIAKVKAVFMDDDKTALPTRPAYIELQDPTSAEVRFAISSYTHTRTAQNDVLILYFSGHGVPLGVSDFGLCTKDTSLHPIEQSPNPLTLVRFTDILEALAVAHVNPIFIFDACYSGSAGKRMMVPFGDIAGTMLRSTIMTVAESYALLCSCSDRETTIDTDEGGQFTNLLLQTIEDGNPNLRKKEHLSAKDIFDPLRKIIESSGLDTAPRLYLGQTMIEEPIARNTQHSPTAYRFSPYMRRIVEHYYNSGSPREILNSDLHRQLGSTSYCNQPKLEFAPWGLLEEGTVRGSRRLTRLGEEFARGNATIPRAIILDSGKGAYVPAPDTEHVLITSI